MAETSPESRRMSDDSVRRRTGRGWDEWLAVLDEWGGADQGPGASERHLCEQHGLSPWWAQAVTERYEDERGLRHGR